MTDLLEKWRNDPENTPDNYQPEHCPPDQAEKWTNTRNPGNSSHAKWEWDLLVDLAYIADSNPSTIQDNVKTLLEAVEPGET